LPVTLRPCFAANGISCAHPGTRAYIWSCGSCPTVHPPPRRPRGPQQPRRIPSDQRQDRRKARCRRIPSAPCHSPDPSRSPKFLLCIITIIRICTITIITGLRGRRHHSCTRWKPRQPSCVQSLTRGGCRSWRICNSPEELFLRQQKAQGRQRAQRHSSLQTPPGRYARRESDQTGSDGP
jgi:hypothetical protein